MSQDLRRYYAARAAEYDRVYDKPERQQDLRAIAQWLPGVFEGRRLLELACGTGCWTRFLAPRAAQLLAIDASLETLRIAQSRVERGPPEHDGEGDTYQWRQLADGSRHRVLKNFPSDSALREAVDGWAHEVRVHHWTYFWALEYVVGDPAGR